MTIVGVARANEPEIVMTEAFDLLLTGGTALNPPTALKKELDVGVVGVGLV